MDEEFGMPPGSAIRGGKVGGRVIFRWPAPGNWLERMGPDRVFWIGTAIFGPCAVAVFFIDPVYAVACLFAVLFWAGVCRGRWKTSGYEEVALEDDAIVIRRGAFRAGGIPPLAQQTKGQVVRIGRQRLKEPVLDERRGGRRLVLATETATFELGGGLGHDDLSRLQLFVREWLRM